MITPELFADRGIAWVKAVFEVSNQCVTQLGLLALAAIAVWQNLKTKVEVKERLDRQSERLEATTQAVTQIALASPPVVTPDKPVKTPIVPPPGTYE